MALVKTLESSWDCEEIKPLNPKGNQPWIFTGRTDAEVEALILWPWMQRANSLEKTLMLGKIEGRRRSGGWGRDGLMVSPTQWTWVWVNSKRFWRIGEPRVPQSMGSPRVRQNLANEQQQQWDTLYHKVDGWFKIKCYISHLIRADFLKLSKITIISLRSLFRQFFLIHHPIPWNVNTTHILYICLCIVAL